MKIPLDGVLGGITTFVLSGAVKGYIIQSLSKYTPSDCIRAINSNVDLWDAANISIDPKYRPLIEKYRHLIDAITPNLVLKWIKDARPDLFSAIINCDSPQGNVVDWVDGFASDLTIDINSHKGLKWINDNINNIKSHIIGDGSAGQAVDIRAGEERSYTDADSEGIISCSGDGEKEVGDSFTGEADRDPEENGGRGDGEREGAWRSYRESESWGKEWRP